MWLLGIKWNWSLSFSMSLCYDGKSRWPLLGFDCLLGAVIQRGLSMHCWLLLLQYRSEGPTLSSLRWIKQVYRIVFHNTGPYYIDWAGPQRSCLHFRIFIVQILSPPTCYALGKTYSMVLKRVSFGGRLILLKFLLILLIHPSVHPPIHAQIFIKLLLWSWHSARSRKAMLRTQRAPTLKDLAV